MNIRYVRTSVLISALLLGACAEQPEPTQAPAQGNPLGEATVATVNGAPIYSSIFDAYATGRLQKSVEDLSDVEHDALLDELIQIQLLTAAAEEAGLTRELDIAIELALQRQQLLSRVVITDHLENNPPSEAELRAAYEANIEQLSGPQYKARHILVEEEAEALALIEELQGGADFAQLAMDHSTGPTGPNGGDLGWFSAETMVAPFADAVRAMEVGAFSGQPVQTQFGWHVILLEDAEDQQAPGLDAVRADMTNVVEQQKIEALLESLRESAEIIMTDSG